MNKNNKILQPPEKVFFPAFDTPFGSKSIFHIPDIESNDVEEQATTNKITEGNAQENSIVSTNTTSNDFDTTSDSDLSMTLYLNTIGFEFESDFQKFISGQLPTDYSKTIYEVLEADAGKKPKQMICVYVKGRNPLLPVFRFSKGLCDYILSLIPSNNSSMALDERVEKWAPRIAEIGKDKPGFTYSEDQIKEAIRLALPYSVQSVINKLPKGTDKADINKLYTENYNFLRTLAANPEDKDTELAIRNLCKIAAKLNAEVLKTYNQFPDLRNTKKERSFTANDFYHMANRLLALADKIKIFQTGEFKSQEEVVDFVNSNFVDNTAIGEQTQFVINYPFEKLEYAKRKAMLMLFINAGDILQFSGFFTSVGHEMGIVSKRISKGDIVYNLINTANKKDLQQLIKDLNAEDKLFDLLSNSILGLFAWLCITIGNGYINSLEKPNDQLLPAIKNGNFIFFDNALLGNKNTEAISDKNRKFSFEVSASLLYSIPELAICKNFIDKELANNANGLFFAKKSFDPLDLIVLIPVADMEFSFLKMKKGGMYLLPACTVYAIFREETFEALKILVELAIQIGLCLLGVPALTAAIRAGNVLGIFAGVADITLGTLAATVNTIPEISRNHPDFVKYVNYATLIYGVSRLGYESYKSCTISKLTKAEELGLDEERLRKVENLFDDLGGKLYTEKELKLLKIKLQNEYGVELRLIDKEVGYQKLPVTKGGKTYQVRSKELLKDWNERGVVGKFHEGPPPTMILRSDNASELTVFHEKVHMEIWYNNMPKMHIVDEEKYVFEAIFEAKDKMGWTDAELIDAYDYVNKRVIRDWNVLGKNFPYVNNEYIEQLKWNKQFNIR